MKLKHCLTHAAAGVLLLGSGSALAVGTDANTDVSNTATVNFNVGGVAQTAASSNTVTFEVDRLVNLTVAEVGGANTLVGPGSTDQVLTFNVTNLTNGTIDILLSTAQAVDDFDATNARIYRDTGGAGAGVFDGTDTLVTSLDNVAEDATVLVFVVADIPNGRADGDLAAITLTGQAADAATGTAFVQTGVETEDGVNNDNADNVFADAAGDTDIARDGLHSDTDTYEVASATLTVTKSVTVIDDPVNGTTNPKRVPGATLEYCIVVANSGSAAADTVAVTDDLTGQPVTFVSGSIFVGGAADCTGGTAEDDDNAGGDETDPNGGSFAAGVVTSQTSTVPAASSTSTRFRVTIN